MSDESEVIETEEAEHTEQQGGDPVEALAREHGWNPDGPKSAAEFIASGLDYRRTLKNRLDEVESATKRLDGWREKAEKAGYERAKREIEQRKADAREEGDVEAYERAIKAEQEIEGVRNDGPDPELKAWLERNPWFEKDQVLQLQAKAIDAELQRKHPALSHGELLERIETEMKTRYPEAFGLERKATPPKGEGRTQRGKPNGKSWDKLPSEVQREADAMIKRGWIKDRDEYVATYNGWAE